MPTAASRECSVTQSLTAGSDTLAPAVRSRGVRLVEEFFTGLWQKVQLGFWTGEDNRAAADKVARALRLSSGRYRPRRATC